MARARQHAAVVGLEAPQRLLEIGRGILVQAGDESDPFPREEIEQRLSDAQVVVGGIETAFAFHRQVEPLDPGVVAAQHSCGNLQVQAEPVGVGDNQPAAILVNSARTNWL